MPTSIRHLIGRITSGVLVAGALAAIPATGAGAATVASACTSSPASTASVGGPAYDLFESNGAVVSCGGASLFGSLAGPKLASPVVDGAATKTGSGYWLVEADGGVHNFGGAGFFGSTVHLHLRSPIVGFAPTADGAGYWLITAAGNLFHFGDAGFFGSTVRDKSDGAVISILPTPDAQGYWVVLSTGRVKNFGDATPVGSLAHRRPAVVAATADPDGHGVTLLTKDGGVHPLGTSQFVGSLVHHRLARPLTAITTSTDGGGYLLVNAAGSIYNFGDAPFLGSLASAPPKRPTAVVAMSAITLPTPITAVTLTSVTTSTATPLLPHGALGYDISNFQCSTPGASTASASLPPTSAFSIIEAAGWLDSSVNSCLASEAAWATAAAGPGGAPYSLYLFANSPDQSAGAVAQDVTGPAGTCATLPTASQAGCIAYNYGYGGAAAAFAHAQSVGVTASLWWIDVEGANLSGTEWSNYSAGEFWSSSTSLNADTIEGTIDALRALGVTVGIYSTSIQFPTIAGTFVPSGAQVPLWVAGAPWTNPPYTETGLASPTVLPGWCLGTSGYSPQAPSDLFAGGVPWLLQETPGSEPSPYGIDPDYVC